MTKTRLKTFAAAVAIAAACMSAPAAGQPASLESQRYGRWGFDLAGMDAAVKPGDDFDLFANGGWKSRTEIPADRSTYGVFYMLREGSDARVRDIIEGASRKAGAQGEEAAIGAFYASFMDEARVEQLDAKPLQADLAAIRAARTHEDFARLHGAAFLGFGGSLFGGAIYDDARDPTNYALYLGHSGLGLPDRDYYLDPKFAAQKARYEAYVAQMLGLLGWPNAAAAARDVVAYETRIAEAHWPIAERRDAEKTYNPTTFAELERTAPGYPWRAFREGAELAWDGKVVVYENTAFPKLSAIYAATPVETLRAWAAFQLVDNAAPYLSKRFADAHFELHNRALQGQPEQRPRWKRGVTLVNGQMAQAVGKIYAARYFTADTKAKMDQLVADMVRAMDGRIRNLSWMSAETKARALQKLGTFRSNIGAPPFYRDFSGLSIDRTDLYGNVERAAAFNFRYQKAKLGKPVRKEEWSDTPQTVNAYYRPQRNDITFPAGILQPPFFDPEADPAINYGAIGGVIGHEISHGFDDQGRKSDHTGALRDWWTPEDARKFEAEAAKLVAQYDAFEPLPGSKVNGRLTLGENVSDLAGLTIALDAYRLHLNGRPSPVIDGLTGEQRLFLAWAQVWRNKFRDEALRQYVATDEHSPAMYRINGVVRNMDAWYEAFGVKPGDRLYLPPEQRVRIW